MRHPDRKGPTVKTLIAWLTRRQRCACGKFKLARAATCFDCTIAERPSEPPNISAPAACDCR